MHHDIVLTSLRTYFTLSEPMSVIRLLSGSKLWLSAGWFRGFVWWGKLMPFGGMMSWDFRTRIWDCDGCVFEKKVLQQY